jgi:hypothetical protein
MSPEVVQRAASEPITVATRSNNRLRVGSDYEQCEEVYALRRRRYGPGAQVTLPLWDPQDRKQVPRWRKINAGAIREAQWRVSCMVWS